ncbi:MAG TPA: hypothetical protein ENI37_01300 [Chloroflexi bacterium]|nr:hypothetical protein [Chloroflexota bacterium]
MGSTSGSGSGLPLLRTVASPFAISVRP